MLNESLNPEMWKIDLRTIEDTFHTNVFQKEDKGPDVECQLRTNPGVEELQEDVLELVDYEGHQGEAHPVHVVQPQVHQVLGSVLDGETSPDKKSKYFWGEQIFCLYCKICKSIFTYNCKT